MAHSAFWTFGTNVGVAAVLVRLGVHTYAAALAGILVGSVWNYALSSRFVWGRFR